MESEKLKSIVKETYGEIAKKSSLQLAATTCCGTQCCGPESGDAPHDFTPFNDDYTKLAGYNKDADLLLGCGMPTEIAAISPGGTVLDLGSGAGNDVFVARALVGESGRVIGLDMTEAMIEKARKNAATLGYANVEFRLGDIEAMPIEGETIDVVISNCVLNLVPDKGKAFAEIFRVLRPGGHFAISDVVLTRPLPEGLKQAAEMYSGCVSGAPLRSDFLRLVEQAGFKAVSVKITKPITLPDEVLGKYLSPPEIETFKRSGSGIESITVYGERP